MISHKLALSKISYLKRAYERNKEEIYDVASRRPFRRPDGDFHPSLALHGPIEKNYYAILAPGLGCWNSKLQ